MKHSIKKIFKNLSLFLISATIVAGFGVLVAIEHTNSYKKLDNLSNQKEIISSIINLPKENIELYFIQINGKTTQLIYDIEKLRSFYQYSFAERFLQLNSKEYLGDLDKLNSLCREFNTKANSYYNDKSEYAELKENEFKQSAALLNEHINSIVFKALTYNKTTFNIYKKVTYFVFIIILLVSIWYRKRLNAIYKDLEFLNNANLTQYTVFSEEANAISLRIKRKPVLSENPAMLDAVTGVNNIKGMMNSYAEKKGMKDNNFTAVTVFEVDNFSKTNKVYSLEITQRILKKIAFSISLHQQITDVVARTDYNQFTIIFSRSNKEQLFKEIDAIRQSISELKLNSPEFGDITITLSGGYVIKPNNVSLEESIRQAKKVLKHAQKNGENIISQIKDLAQSEL